MGSGGGLWGGAVSQFQRPPTPRHALVALPPTHTHSLLSPLTPPTHAHAPIHPHAPTAGDAVVIFNFRADRVIELSKAFEYSEFTAFDRKRWPKTRFVGIMQV